MTRGKNTAVVSSVLVLTLMLVMMLCGCGGKEAAQAPAEPVLSAAPVAQGEPAVPSETETPSSRQDGERFEETIVLEGMEENVGYEHVKNKEAGYEMDYEFDSLDRVSGSKGDRFISHNDDPDDPWNYLEVSYFDKDIDTVTAEIFSSLLDQYDLVVPGPYTLERAGSCTQLSASEAREGNSVPGSLQTAYIIPAGEGCIAAIAHCTMESAGGFGARFSSMLNTLTLIG